MLSDGGARLSFPLQVRVDEGAEKEFVKFHCEDGQVQSIQGGISQFIEALIDPTRTHLVDLDLLSLAEHKGLHPSAQEHLAFRVPLCVGGEYSVANLAVESVELHLGMTLQLVAQSLDAPDGTRIHGVT